MFSVHFTGTSSQAFFPCSLYWYLAATTSKTLNHRAYIKYDILSYDVLSKIVINSHVLLMDLYIQDVLFVQIN